MNYVTVLDFPDGEKYKKFWPADVHIIGAEINKFHSIFWPALLLSIKAPLPKAVFVHGLFTVNGQKMSKTLGNVIDPINMVNEFGQDATRYLLLSQFSALEHGDVKQSDLSVKYNADLANGLGNLFERVFTLIINNGINLEKEKIDPEIKNWAKETEEKYHSCMQNYLLFEALREIFLFAKKLDKYIDDKKPWLNPDSIVLNSLFNGIEKILEWIEPFMPNKTRQVKDYIEKIKNKKLSKDEKLNLFPRIK
jgi:methionyl-tRNA synthetase